MAVLDPNHRKLLSQALRPPLGCTFDRAIATTYTLDLTTLLTVPLHLAQFAAESQGEALRDGIALLEALQRTSRRLSIFCQAGAIGAPSLPHMLYCLLEDVVVPVLAPHKGAFHPKLWLLRFVARDGQPKLRLLVLSRNLTADRSWDTALWLDGEVGTRDRASNRPLVDLLLALPGLAVGAVTDAVRASVSEQAQELRRAVWELPAGYDDITFDVLGWRREPWAPPPSHELLVVSPFVDAAALLSALKTTGAGTALISRGVALDALPASVRGRFAQLKVLDEAAETESGDDREDPGGKPSPQTALSGLHAKICVLARGWHTSVVVGSANATSPAWLTGKNVELVVTLTGKRSKVGGIEEFLGKDGIGSLLIDYTPATEPPAPDPAEIEAEAALDAASRALVVARMELHCAGESDAWQLTLKIPQAVVLPGIVALRIWTVSQASGTAVDAAGLMRGEAVTLTTSPLAHVTGLVAFELVAAAMDRRVRFVLNLPIIGLPAGRDAALVRSVVMNRDGFLRYLLMLLGGGDDLNQFMEGSGGSVQVWRSGSGGDLMPLLEQLTGAWAHGRHDELRGIDRLVTDLQKTEAGREILPPDFVEVWSTFRQVLATVAGEAQ